MARLICPNDDCGMELIEQDNSVRILLKDGTVKYLPMFWCEHCCMEIGVER